MEKRIIVCLFLLCSNNVFADNGMALNLICSIQIQYVCSIDGCNKNPPSVTIKVRQSESDKAYYSRCDNKGCDQYESTISPSGVYILFNPGGKSASLKVDSRDMSFMEIG